MRILKEPRENTRKALKFFKKHYEEIGEIKYVILYYAEEEWAIYHVHEIIFHQFVIIIGKKAQIWLGGLTWGYYGHGPSVFLELMQLIDSSITYEEIAALEWAADYSPIMYEKVNGKLISKPFGEPAESMIRNEDNLLPWDIRNVMKPSEEFTAFMKDFMAKKGFQEYI